MSSSLKNDISTAYTSEFEVDAPERSRLRAVNNNFIDGLRLALTVLALAAGIVVLGVSADSLATYRQTHLPPDFFLPLWPERFDARPTVALVAGGVIVVLANAVSLKTQALRRRLATPQAIAVVNIIVSLAAVIATSFVYAANASASVDTLQSWACRWKTVPMSVQPHFGTLCMQSRAGVALAVLLEALIVGLAAYQAVVVERDRRRSL